MPKARYSIVLLGELHRDPMRSVVLVKLFAALQGLGIVVSCLEEDSEQQTLENRLKGLLALKDRCQSFIPKFGLNPWLKKDPHLQYPYFKLQDLDKIIEVCSQHLAAPKAVVAQVASEFHRVARYSEEIKFTEFMIKANIPYAGIDSNKALGRVWSLYEGEQKYWSAEHARTYNMARKILNFACQSMPKGGVIGVPLGMNHAKRVAAMLELLTSEKGEFYTQGDFLIQTRNLFSPYSMDGEENYQLIEQDGLKLDPAEIIQMYPALDFQNVYCHEDPKNHSLQEDFTRDLIQKIQAHLKGYSYSISYFGKDHEHKKALVEEKLKGEILASHQNHSMQVILDPELLVKAVRAQLGLERKKIDLKKHAADILVFLRSHKRVTLEKIFPPAKWYVTYPVVLKDRIEKALLNWENFKEEEKQLSVASQRIQDNPQQFGQILALQRLYKLKCAGKATVEPRRSQAIAEDRCHQEQSQTTAGTQNDYSAQSKTLKKSFS